MLQSGTTCVTTPYGDLKDEELDMAITLYYFFYDMVNDGNQGDFRKARNLYADPVRFFKEASDEMNPAHKRYPADEKESESEEEDYDDAEKRLLKEHNEQLLEEIAKEVKNELDDYDHRDENTQEVEPMETESNRVSNRNSDFSASFYGPLYEEEGAPKPQAKAARLEGDGYFYVHQTHKGVRAGRYTYTREGMAHAFRYYLLTHPDNQGRVCLHLAAGFGDKDFCTMLVWEADYLGFGAETIDKGDRLGLTPLYLLSEDGYRSRDYPDDDNERAIRELQAAGGGI